LPSFNNDAINDMQSMAITAKNMENLVLDRITILFLFIGLCFILYQHRTLIIFNV